MDSVQRVLLDIAPDPRRCVGNRRGQRDRGQSVRLQRAGRGGRGHLLHPQWLLLLLSVSTPHQLSECTPPAVCEYTRPAVCECTPRAVCEYTPPAV